MNEERLRACVQQDCELVVLASVTSTNDELASRLQARGDKIALDPLSRPLLPLVVVSTEQTAGRGRLGRTWASPQGGLYISVGLGTPPEAQSSVSALSPLMALAVRDALAEFAVTDVLIKWPNDVFSSSGKLAGILLESKNAISPGTLVLGLGINVNRPVEGAFEGAGYLDDGAAGPLPLGEVAAAVIDSALSYCAAWRTAGYSFAPFRAAYSENMRLLGEWVFVRDALGEEVAQGTVEGIDDYGRLLLAHPEGTSAIFAGEITLRNDAR